MSAHPRSTVTRFLFAAMVPVCAAAAQVACAGGDGATAPSASTRYEGVLTSGVERGVVTLQSGNPAIGSLTVGENAPIALSGSSANGKFTLTGGGYTLAASTTSDGALLGTVTGGQLQALANLGALASSEPGSAVRYCGVYTGGDAGMGDVLVQGSKAVATVTGMGGGFSISGSAKATGVNLRIDTVEAVTRRPVTITANLARTADTLYGTAENSLYMDDDPTVVVATRGGCNATRPPGPYTVFTGFMTKVDFLRPIQLYTAPEVRAVLSTPNAPATFIGGTYNSATGVFHLSGSGITVRATVVGNRFTGTVTGGPWDGATLLGLGGTAAQVPQHYCGNQTGVLAGQMAIVAIGTDALGAWLAENRFPRTVGGSFGGAWVYLSDGGSTFWAGSRDGLADMNGTWSSDLPAVGGWSASLCFGNP